MKVVVGQYLVNGNGKLEDSTVPVQFDGQLIAYADRRTETGTAGERLYRTSTGLLVVWVRASTENPPKSAYSLHRVTRADLLPGGRFAEVGAKAELGGEALSLNEALDLSKSITGETMITQALMADSSDIAALLPADADKDTKYRLSKFKGWLGGRSWHDPDLARYRDWLLAEGYAAATVSAHLSTVRGRYQTLTRDNATRDLLYVVAARTTANKVEQKAFVDEAIVRMENAADPANSPVKVVTSQDRADSEFLRLTREQAEALMAAPGTSTLKGLRDTAVIALLLCTGIREAELCALEVRDLRQRLGGELALHVREGKGRKERLIPYGCLSWVLLLVDAWLSATSIEEGPVFRGLYKGGKLRPGPLSVRAIQYILASYPVVVEGEPVKVRPHDCRRTYTRRLYECGADPLAIKDNLGHADLKTTLGYIGTLDADRRRAPAIYSPPHLLGQLELLT